MSPSVIRSFSSRNNIGYLSFLFSLSNSTAFSDAFHIFHEQTGRQSLTQNLAMSGDAEVIMYILLVYSNQESSVNNTLLIDKHV